MDIDRKVQKKSERESGKDLDELRNRLTKMKFDISKKQTKNHREIRKIKKEIARILTAKNQNNK